MPGAILIFIIVVLWGLSSYVKNSRSNGRSRQQGGSEKQKEQSRKKTAAVPQETSENVILERARKNTREVHMSHQNTAAKRSGAASGGQPARGAGRNRMERSGNGERRTASAGRTEFGHGPLTEAADGASALSSAKQREERLREELYREQTDTNSRTGQNRIMEAARENSLETRLDNLEDAQQDLMKEVERLMVLGPDTTVAFARDFTAEGIELMNRLY